ncbi:hypothetical protein BC03BB108_A0010 [Bacillus cereus 03BB108]|nr:hypothetical protein AK40_5663 [Bacillus cereus 03BB108]EDX60191.1 hypothetical protein BC03BB108_A0010 [Bacillus cereus 03BB108]KMP15584.1 hypothetical protein TQ94_19240 [Bacillus cereus]BCC62158.1 hypothetical protein BCJMU10_p1072 [Bacillus cereus]BCC80094.1 hypothetical protein BCJMU62_p1189 [Bacillus cereus]
MFDFSILFGQLNLRFKRSFVRDTYYETLMIVKAAPTDPPIDRSVATKRILLNNCNWIVSPAFKLTITSLLKADTLRAGLNIEAGIGVVLFNKILEPAPIPTAAVVLI